MTSQHLLLNSTDLILVGRVPTNTCHHGSEIPPTPLPVHRLITVILYASDTTNYDGLHMQNEHTDGWMIYLFIYILLNHVKIIISFKIYTIIFVYNR